MLTAYAFAVGRDSVDERAAFARCDEPVGAAAKVRPGHLLGGARLLRPGDVDAVVAHCLCALSAKRAAFCSLPKVVER